MIEDPTPTLDDLRAQEAVEFENLSRAFIRYSLARNAVNTRLLEVRKGHPTLFDN